ncbi:MAG: hypothetical protein GOV01_03405, partial [Candidatus Altiarchaeota archaeon]|nr:hypothetical protein [Candidatus Altiarchaeota archaeon]
MKICKRCGRTLKAKRWVLTKPAELGHAELMGDVETTICEDCTRHPESHSAVLQVRGMPENELEKILLEELTKSENRGQRQQIYKKGLNYHLTSKSMARSIGRRLNERGADMKETSKIITFNRLRSKDVTRITVRALFVVFPGDVIEYGNQLYLVDKLGKKFVYTEEG